MYLDPRGVALSPTDPAAAAAFEQALESLRSYRGDPLAALDRVLAIDPAFPAAHAARALVLLTLFERRFTVEAGRLLAESAPLIGRRATPTERAWAEAARHLAAGEWSAGLRVLDRQLVEHPRDILALQVAHLFDFCRGDALNLRNRVSRVLPHWSREHPGRPFVLGMQAFGYEECNQYPQAEATALEALAGAPEDCWAVHAAVHVMEMQGRSEEGIRFLEARRRDWAGADNGFAFHNHWHLALFHLDHARHDRVLAIHDEAIAGGTAMALPRIDATAMLWRLQLEGVDVGARFSPVADAWEADLEGEAGFYAFNDFHAAMAFAATGRTRPLSRLRDAMEAAAWGPGFNAEMARGVGADAVEGVVAFSQGRYREAVRRLEAVRDGASRFGGSHAQRDILTLTLVEAARRAGQQKLAAHYARERIVHKPESPWGWRVLDRVQRSPDPHSPGALALAGD